MKARFAQKIGRVVLGVYVDPKTEGHRHTATISRKVSGREIFDGGSYCCDVCKQKFLPDTYDDLWDTPSGELEPGCLFWYYNYPENFWWDNHKGPHLWAVLPTGARWCIDSRASNCNRPNDRTTRCWRREGTPPNINTMDCGCGAGAGSIYAEQGGPREWHGFLHHGEFHT